MGHGYWDELAAPWGCITGYSGGLDIKRRLLAIEGVVV